MLQNIKLTGILRELCKQSVYSAMLYVEIFPVIHHLLDNKASLEPKNVPQNGIYFKSECTH